MTTFIIAVISYIVLGTIAVVIAYKLGYHFINKAEEPVIEYDIDWTNPDYHERYKFIRDLYPDFTEAEFKELDEHMRDHIQVFHPDVKIEPVVTGNKFYKKLLGDNKVYNYNDTLNEDQREIAQLRRDAQDDPESTKKLVFHGHCLDCATPELAGVGMCLSCRYANVHNITKGVSLYQKKSSEDQIY